MLFSLGVTVDDNDKQHLRNNYIEIEKMIRGFKDALVDIIEVDRLLLARAFSTILAELIREVDEDR